MTRNGHTLEYMDFLKRLGVNAKPKNQLNKAGKKLKLMLFYGDQIVVATFNFTSNPLLDNFISFYSI